MVKLWIWSPGVAPLINIVPVDVTGVPIVPTVVIVKFTAPVGIPDTVTVLVVVFFTKVIPAAGNPVMVTSVASPPHINTMSSIAVPLFTDWLLSVVETKVWLLPATVGDSPWTKTRFVT